MMLSQTWPDSDENNPALPQEESCEVRHRSPQNPHLTFPALINIYIPVEDSLLLLFISRTQEMYRSKTHDASYSCH